MAAGIDVGAHLRAVRTMYGMSQRELAKRAGVTNGLISLIEQNRVSPSVVFGRDELTVGGDGRVLGPGDAYYFTSAVPHRFRNAHKEAREIISASTPPTF